MTLRRHTPLEPTPFPPRRRPMRRRSPRRIARETPEEKFHKVTIRNMTICDASMNIVLIDGCFGELQASHLGTGGMGQKRGDWRTATMLCEHHHDELDGRTRAGRLGKMPKPDKRAYRAAAMARARAFVASYLPLDPGPA